MSQPALFLDRDGTLVQPRHYPTRPDELLIFAGVPELLRLFQRHGWRIVVITNQSGVARGYLSEGELASMHCCMAADLGRRGVRLDGVYHCPHHPDGTVAPFNVACECRKPSPGMLLRAAAELDLDLGRSWFLGDILDDVEAGHRAGCRAALVDLGSESRPESALRTPELVGRDTVHALRAIAAVEGLAETAELDYLPPAWGLVRTLGQSPAMRAKP
ncbi:MAG TPA: HAD family hydrolase [Chloroflexaceae bacterium]|nr:HAD family hydrolase [Chloroflexaceae bacterium]